jgi:hypothetical protein
MKHARSVRRLLSVVLLAWVFDVPAVNIEPLPGSTPQTTRIGAFFANDLGVIVRDEAGAPLAGVPVIFAADGLGVATWAGPAVAPMTVTFTSDADGIAVVPWLMALNPGTTGVVASTADGAVASFELTVADGPIWDLQGVQGNGQSAPVGTEYRVRWAVRVLDENRQPIPYGCVMFNDGEPWNAGGSYGDTTDYFGLAPGDFPVWPRVIARADENGIAVAPTWIANDNAGHHWAIAMACAGGHVDRRSYAPRALFQYTNTPLSSVH